MPAQRLFVWLALATLLTAASAAVPAFAAVALAGDLVLVMAFFVDRRRAARTPLCAERILPSMLVQGVEAEVAIEVDGPAADDVRVVLREGLAAGLAPAALRQTFDVPAGGRATWRYRITPRRRGTHRLAPLVARLRGPWGLAWSQRTMLDGTDVSVYPQMRWEGRVGRLLLLAHRRALGRNPRPLRGVGSEPYALRAYRPGDPLGKVHWKASAKHSELISREDTWERGARLVVLLDCGRAMSAMDQGRSKLDHALAAALALVRVAAARGDQVTIVAFADRVLRAVRVRGQRGVQTAYAALYDVEATLAEPAYDLAVAHAARLETRRATAVVLTSVVDLAAADVLRQALVELERRHRPMLINLGDPELEALARTTPRHAIDVFAAHAALEIRDANQRLAGELRHAGIRAVTAPADRLALATLESYLALFGPRATSVAANGRARAVG